MKYLKDDRSIVPYILLGILTLGIYPIWYLHCLVKDVNVLCAEDGKRSSGVLALLLLSIVTCGLYAIFWWYRIGDMLGIAVRRRGLSVSISGGSVLVCFILGSYVCGVIQWIGIHSIFEAANALAHDYNMQLRTRPSEVLPEEG